MPGRAVLHSLILANCLLIVLFFVEGGRVKIMFAAYPMNDVFITTKKHERNIIFELLAALISVYE